MTIDNNINKINSNNNIKNKSKINQFPLKIQTKPFNSVIELTKSFCSSLNENNKIQLGLFYSYINNLINLTHIDPSRLKTSTLLKKSNDLLLYLLESTIDLHNPVHDRPIKNSLSSDINIGYQQAEYVSISNNNVIEYTVECHGTSQSDHKDRSKTTIIELNTNIEESNTTTRTHERQYSIACGRRLSINYLRPLTEGGCLTDKIVNIYCLVKYINFLKKAKKNSFQLFFVAKPSKKYFFVSRSIYV